MSMKPKIILTEEVTTQIQEFEIKRDQLANTRSEIEERFNTIQQVIQENASLEAKARKLIEEFTQLDEAENAKRKEYFPEIRLGILQKIVEFIGVPPPPEGSAPAAGSGDAPPAPEGSPVASAPPGESGSVNQGPTGDANRSVASSSGNDTPSSS